jgi:hypothetical protein
VTSPGRELATRKPDPSVNITGELATLGDVWSVSEVLAMSDLVPSALYGHPAAIFQVIVTGQRLNLHWTEAIRVIYSPGKGQIGMMTQFLLSQLRKAGHKYSAVYSEDGESCTFCLTRKDEPDSPYLATFSRQDAIDAKLIGKDNWVKYFKRMLRARAIADCVSFGAPEMALGFNLEGDEFTIAPEVQLRPETPAPPEPGQAATGQAAQAGQLRDLDERMQAQLQADGIYEATLEPMEDSGVGGPGETGPSGDSGMGGTSGPEPATDTELPLEAQDFAPPTGEAQGPETPAPMDRELAGGDGAREKAATQLLSEDFTTLGWPPRQYRADVLRACSMFAGRRITGVRDLKAAEVMALRSELGGLIRKHPAEPTVALADLVSKWAEKFAETDPNGYADYEAGQ